MEWVYNDGFECKEGVRRLLVPDARARGGFLRTVIFSEIRQSARP